MDKYQIAWEMLKAYMTGKLETKQDNKFGQEVMEKVTAIEKLLSLKSDSIGQ